MAEQEQSIAPKTAGTKGLHDGKGPCGHPMTDAQGNNYTCTYYCCRVLDDNGTHSGMHSCEMYGHDF